MRPLGIVLTVALACAPACGNNTLNLQQARWAYHAWRGSLPHPLASKLDGTAAVGCRDGGLLKVSRGQNDAGVALHGNLQACRIGGIDIRGDWTGEQHDEASGVRTHEKGKLIFSGDLRGQCDVDITCLFPQRGSPTREGSFCGHDIRSFALDDDVLLR